MTTQRSLVMDVLQREGRIEAYDAVYHLTDNDGKPQRITRLAAVIWHLRHIDGWDIETTDAPGRLAVYTLKSVGEVGVPPIVPTQPLRQHRSRYVVSSMLNQEIPKDWRGWECSRCGEAPASEPVKLLDPNFARARCPGENKPMTFIWRPL